MWRHLGGTEGPIRSVFAATKHENCKKSAGMKTILLFENEVLKS